MKDEGLRAEIEARRRGAGRQAWGLVAVLAAGLVLVVLAGRRTSPPARDATAVRAAATAPASLARTEVDGTLEVDAELAAAGGVRLPRDLRRYFDYFLSAAGEEDEAAIRARIVAHAGPRLSARALARLEGVLDRYLALRRALSGSLPDDLGARLEALR